MKSIVMGTALLALATTAAGAVEDPINTSPHVTTAVLDDCESLARQPNFSWDSLPGDNLGTRLRCTVRALSGSSEQRYP
jgi:hypothetical protein